MAENTADSPLAVTRRGGAARSEHTLRWALRFLGVVMIGWVLLRLDEPARLLTLFWNALGWQLGVALALNFLVVLLKVLRWRALLLAAKVELPLALGWTSFNAASYVGLLTPGRVGDLLRVRYLTHDDLAHPATALASVVVDRLWDLLIVFAFAGFGVVHLGGAVLVERVGALPLLALPVLLALPGLLFVPSIERFVLTRLAARLPLGGTAVNGARAFIESVRVQLRGAPLAGGAFTLAAVLVIFCQGWLLSNALGVPLNPADVIALLSLGTVLGLLPVSISGLGVREALFAMLFPLLHYSAEQGVAFGLMVFSVMYLPMVGYGFFVWQSHPPPLGFRTPSGDARNQVDQYRSKPVTK